MWILYLPFCKRCKTTIWEYLIFCDNVGQLSGVQVVEESIKVDSIYHKGFQESSTHNFPSQMKITYWLILVIADVY